MANIKKVVQEISETFGIRYEQKRNIGVGERQGFMLLVQAPMVDRVQNVMISLCASINGSSISYDQMDGLNLPDNTKYYVNGNRIDLLFPVKGNVQANFEKAVAIMQKIFNRLRELEAVNCDVMGNVGASQVYLIQNEYTFMTEESAAAAQSNLDRNLQAEKEVSENYVLGTVGALVGALVGVAAIILIARLNFILYISGVVMAGIAIWGYKKLGKRFTLISAIICSVICVAMTYLAFRIDVAIEVFNAFDGRFAFSDCLANAKGVFEAVGIAGDYYAYLVKMMLIGGIGAIATCWVTYAGQKDQYKVQRIS